VAILPPAIATGVIPSQQCDDNDRPDDLIATSWEYAMKDFEARVETLLTEAEDCDLIAKLATDPQKRELYRKLAADLRSQLERLIGRTPDKCACS
jgi:hypothetical protein